jgi:hypothetical protein
MKKNQNLKFMNMDVALKFLYDSVINLHNNKGAGNNRNYPNRFIKKRNRNVIGFNKRNKENSYLRKNCLTFDSVTKSLSNEINKLKLNQTTTNKKLDTIINNLTDKNNKHEKKNNEFYKVNKFNFEILQKPNHYDYFSFKIKPDTLAKNTDGASKARKASSPDNLLNHRFFEDTETFRNYNLITEKTIELTTDNLKNPFALSGNTHKSVSSTNSNLRCHSNPHRQSNLFTTRTGGLNIKSSEHSGDHSENEKPVLLKTNTLECTNSEIAESESQSQCSSKYFCGSSISQEGFKKVRGFNFKNNIKTKKFHKPLIRQLTQEEKISELSEIKLENNSVEVIQEEKTKIKKFNFNNNINIKKFIRKGSNTMIEDNSCSLSINDLNK